MQSLKLEIIHLFKFCCYSSICFLLKKILGEARKMSFFSTLSASGNSYQIIYDEKKCSFISISQNSHNSHNSIIPT